MHAGLAILAEEGRPGGWTWRFQRERPVRTVPVVVLDVDPEYLLEVAETNDQQLVQALGADRANPALRVGIGVRRLYRRDEHVGAFGAEHAVEATAELRVTVADKKAHRAAPFAQHQE
jgi:hypothetical protein